MIEHRQSAIPFIIVVVDRRGADLYWSTPDATGHASVEGDDTFLRKVHAGGWSQERFQQRAENTWEHTTREIAARLGQLVDEVAPRVVPIAGDVRMTQLLRAQLPSAVVELLHDVPGGRSRDGSEADRQSAAMRWIRSAVAEDTAAVLRLFDDEAGQHDRAANGAEVTFEALRESRVDILLVHDDPDDPRRAYFVEADANVVSCEQNTLTALGHSTMHSGRIVDVAIRAAVATGAGLRVVPRGTRLADRIGALLRW